jgi:hypothetical protein
MPCRHRWIRLALAVALSIAALSADAALTAARMAFTPFVPVAPPQRVLADLDGDGRLDTALIQDTPGDHRLRIELSGSRTAVHLEPPVTAVIEGDIDHDGDLDLVAATPSGDVLVWLNDGHGRFTRQEASRAQVVSGAPAFSQALWPEALLIGVRAPVVPSPNRTATAVVVLPFRAPAIPAARDVVLQTLPALRGPPAHSA